MKDLIKYFDFPIMLLLVLVIGGGGFSVIGGGWFVFDYISDAQRFAAYQKALETITKCRSSMTGDVEAIFIDNLCGKVPTSVDFGIVER